MSPAPDLRSMLRFPFWDRIRGPDAAAETARVDARINKVAPDAMSLGDRVLLDSLAWKVAEYGPSEETDRTAKELAGRYPTLVGEVIVLMADGWTRDGFTEWSKGDHRRSMTRGQQVVLERLDRSRDNMTGPVNRTGQDSTEVTGQGTGHDRTGSNGQTGHRSSDRSPGEVKVTGHARDLRSMWGLRFLFSWDRSDGPVSGPVGRVNMTGQPVDLPDGDDLLSDVLGTVKDGEVKVSIGTVLDRLTDSDPDGYRELTTTMMLSVLLRSLGMDHQIWEIRRHGDRYNLRGSLLVTDVEEALDRLDPVLAEGTMWREPLRRHKQITDEV